AAEVDVALRARAPSVRGRAELADQAQLLERGLEFRSEHPPFDPLDRGERGLDGGALALGAEVRAQAIPQVSSASDVEDLLRPVSRSSWRFRNETSKRALCATRVASPPNVRKRRTASSTRGARLSSSSRSPVSRLMARGSRTPGATSVWNVPPSSSSSTLTAP